MDAFFAAVEQRDKPELQNLPVVVGGDPNSRGVVSTCSYEARKYGIHSAMPASRAYRLCPNAIFLRPRFTAYREASQQIRSIFRCFTDLVEAPSLDEAYLDVSDAKDYQSSATDIARAIKQLIFKETQLTASAGVSYNKFLAKLASDVKKPNGLFVITPKQGPDYIANLAIDQFHGVGKATSKKMHALGIKTGLNLKNFSQLELQQNFGKAGLYYYQIARGIDNRPVISHRQRKSLGSETTFQQDLKDFDAMNDILQKLAEEVWHQVKEKALTARTLTIKVKFDNFEQITRSKTLDYSIIQSKHLPLLVKELLAKTEAHTRKVRLLGVCLSGLSSVQPDSPQQMDIFEHL